MPSPAVCYSQAGQLAAARALGQSVNRGDLGRLPPDSPWPAGHERLTDPLLATAFRTLPHRTYTSP